MGTISRRRFMQWCLGAGALGWATSGHSQQSTGSDAPGDDTAGAGPLWANVPDLAVAQGGRICLRELLQDPHDPRIRIRLDSTALPDGITYDPDTACLSVSPDAPLRTITGLVIVVEVGP